MTQHPTGPRIFFDVTDLRTYLIEHRSLTGIQRVVVMILVEVGKLIGAENVYLSFFDIDTGQYRTISSTLLKNYSGTVQEQLVAALNVQSADHFIRPTLEKYENRGFRRSLHTAIREIQAWRGNERHFRKRRSSIAEWRESRPKQAMQRAAHHDFFSVARAGDVVFLAGASWFRDSAAVFRKVRRSGARVIALIHDLIPIVTPKFVASEHPVLFHDWLLDSLGYIDRYIANSKATGDDLRRFINVYKGKQAVAVAPLAQDRIPDDAPVAIGKRRRRVDKHAYPDLYDGVVMSEHIRALTKMPYVLVVGTTDIRKNIWSLLQAWIRLIRHEDMEIPKLVIAGRVGAMNGDCEDLLAATGNLGGWVTRVIGPSDLELDFLYRKCLFTAMPSYYEGWGLPIGESLSYGKTAVVSHTSSMPEVGEDYVEYCDPHSIDSIFRACLTLIGDVDHRRALEARIATASLRSWSHVARDITDILLEDAPETANRQRLARPREVRREAV